MCMSLDTLKVTFNKSLHNKFISKVNFWQGINVLNCSVIFIVEPATKCDATGSDARGRACLQNAGF
jgi:hypothetical protein